MNTEELKQTLYAKVEEINDLDIRRFTKQALDNTSEWFWVSPCSGTRKHHPPENQVEGGIIIHTLKCIPVAKDLCYYFNLNPEDTNIVVAGVILHDIKKFGEPWGQSSDKEHGRIGAEYLERFELKELAKTEIKNCVRYHMGRFEKQDKNLTSFSMKEYVVQVTDFFCSREYASWLPGRKLNEDEIKDFILK